MTCLSMLLALSAIGASPLEWQPLPDGYVLQVSSTELDLTTVDGDGGTFARMALPHAGVTGEVGNPALPVYRQLVEVPYGAEVEVNTECSGLIRHRLSMPAYPLQPPLPKSGPVPPFVFSRWAYAQDRLEPALRASIVDTAFSRGRRLVLIEVYPVSYNPVQSVAELWSNVTVHVRWRNADWSRTNQARRRYLSRPYVRRLSGIVPNHEAFIDPPDLPVGYLVIVPDVWADNVEPLARWRHKKGYHVFVRTLSQVGGGSASVVKSYIQSAYDDWPIPPSFVLLVGDVDRVGYFTGEGTDNPPTDLTFALLEGNDYKPDVDLSRASVATSAELDSLVGKIVDYETDPGEEPTWMERGYFIASADTDFHHVAERSHRYVMTKMRAQGMVCDSLWLYYGTGTPIVEALNGGRAWATYSGHGGHYSWCSKNGSVRLDVNGVHMLCNAARLPFVQSYACLCGDFTRAECFSEAWIRAGVRAGIASLASSVTSWWWEDDTLERRVADCMLDSTFYWTMGGINKAKLAFLQQMGPGSDTRRYFEMYNLMGDGAVDVHTAQPSALTVDHPGEIPIGSYTIQVDVRHSGVPVGDALVCVAARVDTAVFASQYTDAQGHVSLPVYTTSTDTIDITVTGHNLRTYEGVCLVGVQRPTPVPQSPPNGSTVYTLAPTLVVSNTGAQVYEFAVLEGSDTIMGALVPGTPSWTVYSGYLQDRHTYQWTARAHYAGGSSDWLSPKWSFTTEALPPQPTRVSPPNGDTIRDLHCRLQVATIPGATHYHFQLFRDLVLYDEHYEATPYADFYVDDGQTYNWWSRAMNENGWGQFNSSKWYFTAETLAGAPVPVAPLTGDTVRSVRPYLEVYQVPGADKYGYEVWEGGTCVRQAEVSSRQWKVSPELVDQHTYSWTTRVLKGGAWGDWFAPRQSFTVDISPPPAPALLYPPNGATVNTMTPILQVARLPSADEYHFKVYEGGLLVTQETTSAPEWVTDSSFQLGHTYRWYVRARNENGWGDSSAQWTFTLVTALTTPSPPTLLAPGNGDTVETARPELVVESIPDGRWYRFRVYQDGVQIRDDSASRPRWTVFPALERGRTYSWKARAANCNGWGDYSGEWSFTARDAYVPDPPELESPLPGDTVVTLTPVLRVRQGEVAAAATVPLDGETDETDLYNFVVKHNGSPVRSGNVASISWQVSPALPDSESYTWTCRAHNTAGWGNFASEWPFTVLVMTAPGPPEPISPGDDDTVWVTTPTLEVIQQAGVDSSHFVVYQGGNEVRNSRVPGCIWAVAPPLENNVTYTWKTQCHNRVGWGGYHRQYSFAVHLGPPHAPQPLHPPNGQPLPGDTVTLVVDSIPGVDLYHFRLFLRHSDSVVREDTLSRPRYVIWQSLPGDTFTWDCSAHNINGWGSASERWSFVVPTTGIGSSRDVMALEEFQCFPNPFSHSLSLAFGLSRAGVVSAVVYAPDGRRVADIASGEFQAGKHMLKWGGLDQGGSEVSNGIYFLVLAAGDAREVRKVMLTD